MPKDNLTDETTKRATRKRAVRRVASPSSDTPRVARASVRSASNTTTSATRKAPTRINTEVKSKRSRLKFAATGVGLLAVCGLAVWLGVSDEGQINVSAAIAERANTQANVSGAKDANGQIIPVQNTPPVVEASNLRPRGVGTPLVDSSNPPPEVVSTSTEELSATSTVEMASTTEGTSTDQTEVEEESDASTEESTPVTEEGVTEGQ